MLKTQLVRFIFVILSITSVLVHATEQSELKSCEQVQEYFSKLILGYEQQSKQARSLYIKQLETKITELESSGKTSNIDDDLCMYSLYLMITENSKALEQLNNYLKIVPDDPMVLYMASQLQRELNDLKGAHENISMAIKLGRRSPQLFFERALINYQMKNYQNALSDINQEFDIRGNIIEDVSLYNLRGEVQQALGNYKLAAQDFQLAIDLIDKLFPCGDGSRFCYNEERVDSYANLINLYCISKQVDKANKVYQRNQGVSQLDFFKKNKFSDYF